MSDLRLDWSGDALRFESDLMVGEIVANGQEFQVANLVWKRSGTPIDRGMALAPYRLLARSAWMGEARAMRHAAKPTGDGLAVTFEPTRAHQARLLFTLRIEPDAIDCAVDIASYAQYIDYELMVSAYFAPGFRPGGYIGPGVRGERVAPTQVMPVENPVYQDMYLAFPRDERGAQIVTDGRWQRGRHFTRFAPVRYYGLPLGFYRHTESELDVLLMARAEDLFAVSMAYHSDDPHDDVGQHRSLYLSLFGCGLYPGERRQASYRLQLGDFGGNPDVHQRQHAAFLAAHPAPGYLDITEQIDRFLHE